MYPKSALTRQHILERSRQLFNKNGYSGTSMQDITAATGLTKGALYGHFENKDAIALAVFRLNTRTLLDGFKLYMDAAEGVVGKINAMMAYYGDHYLELTLNGGCPFLSAATEFDDRPGEIREHVKAAFAEWQGLIITILSDGQAAKTVKQGIDANKYALLFVSMIEGGIMMTHLYGTPAVLKTVFEQIDHIIQLEILA